MSPMLTSLERWPYLGEALALAAPICWSVAVILFRKTGETVPALVLNQFKNVLASLLFLVTMLLAGSEILREAPRSEYLLLFASGAIGIGISDTFMFLCLNRIGAGLQAIVNTSYSPSIILLGFLFLGERMTAPQLLGAALIVTAVLAVSWTRGSKTDRPRGRLRGILYGLVATTTQGVSIVMVKPLLDESPMLWVTFWRLLGGLLMGALLLQVFPSQRRALSTLADRRVWRVMIPGSIMGTYVALFFWVGGMKYTQASIAAALNQTATLFTFVLAVLVLKEPFTRRRALGVGLGMVGVLMITLGR